MARRRRGRVPLLKNKTKILKGKTIRKDPVTGYDNFDDYFTSEEESPAPSPDALRLELERVRLPLTDRHTSPSRNQEPKSSTSGAANTSFQRSPVSGKDVHVKRLETQTTSSVKKDDMDRRKYRRTALLYRRKAEAKVVQGKRITKDSAGYENFNDYFTDREESIEPSPERDPPATTSSGQARTSRKVATETTDISSHQRLSTTAGDHGTPTSSWHGATGDRNRRNSDGRSRIPLSGGSRQTSLPRSRLSFDPVSAVAKNQNGPMDIDKRVTRSKSRLSINVDANERDRRTLLDSQKSPLTSRTPVFQPFTRNSSQGVSTRQLTPVDLCNSGSSKPMRPSDQSRLKATPGTPKVTNDETLNLVPSPRRPLKSFNQSSLKHVSHQASGHDLEQDLPLNSSRTRTSRREMDEGVSKTSATSESHNYGAALAQPLNIFASPRHSTVPGSGCNPGVGTPKRDESNRIGILAISSVSTDRCSVSSLSEDDMTKPIRLNLRKYSTLLRNRTTASTPLSQESIADVRSETKRPEHFPRTVLSEIEEVPSDEPHQSKRSNTSNQNLSVRFSLFNDRAKPSTSQLPENTGAIGSRSPALVHHSRAFPVENDEISDEPGRSDKRSSSRGENISSPPGLVLKSVGTGNSWEGGNDFPENTSANRLQTFEYGAPVVLSEEDILLEPGHRSKGPSSGGQNASIHSIHHNDLPNPSTSAVSSKSNHLENTPQRTAANNTNGRLSGSPQQSKIRKRPKKGKIKPTKRATPFPKVRQTAREVSCTPNKRHHRDRDDETGSETGAENREEPEEDEPMPGPSWATDLAKTRKRDRAPGVRNDRTSGSTERPRNPPGEDFAEGLRRSKRHKLPVLEFWRNERPIYYKDTIVRVDKGFDDEPLRSRRTRRTQPKAAEHHTRLSYMWAEERLNNEEAMEEDELPEMDCIRVLNPETGEDVPVDCIRTRDSYIFRAMDDGTEEGDNNILMTKTIQQRAFSSGILVMRSKQNKGRHYVRNDTMVFFILEGRLEVTIHKTTALLGTGDSFFVPKGNSYELQNMRDSEARLVFFQLRGDESDEGPSLEWKSGGF